MIQLYVQLHTTGTGGGSQDNVIVVGGDSLQPDAADQDLRDLAGSLIPVAELLCGPAYGPGATVTVASLQLQNLVRDIAP